MIQKDIAKIASLIGDKTRASILIALMEGGALTAGELAIRANISPQTASNHLSKLLRANLVICESTGRHRYYKLSSHLVAQALESLSLVSGHDKRRPPRHHTIDKDICFARTCYDHLAGELGVKLKNALIDKAYIKLDDEKFIVTKTGKPFFNKLGIDVDKLSKQRRHFAKACLDWTEREHHIAGSLGHALLDYFLQNRLVIRSKHKPRVIALTTKGKFWFRSTAGKSCPPI